MDCVATFPSATSVGASGKTKNNGNDDGYGDCIDNVEVIIMLVVAIMIMIVVMVLLMSKMEFYIVMKHCRIHNLNSIPILK